MIGGIYSDEKCPACGAKLVDNRKDGVTCPNHPGVYARNLRVKFKQTYKRFTDYNAADQFLSHLRHDVKSYDPRDYQKKNPLGFANLADQWLLTKAHLRSYRDIKNHINQAVTYYGNTNIKDIQYGELEDFFNSLSCGSKSKHNIRSVIHNFFKWVWKRNRKTFSKDDFPDFPVISFTLGYRKIVSKEVQWQILEEIKRTAPFRAWLACKWLATYTKIRPGELVRITEGDIDRDNGIIRITHSKENRVKYVPMIPEDIEIVRTLPLGVPFIPFFRHEISGHGVKEGRPYGRNRLRVIWSEACKKLGIEGVSLYPGTKHSSVTALNKMGYSPEDIQANATGHLSAAFKRYLVPDVDKSIEMYQASMPGNKREISGTNLALKTGSTNIDNSPF
ncbi:MAG: tyrosine-type recombinase/integrase [Deltaproteobacteria bacterium]|nr:tyrosine-type recombinase/integrase [Deltaproteobacteria bacterium]MBN2686982.1 tyrosine-type recombinase/integrase [Deltaproteobacteria bacterium]